VSLLLKVRGKPSTTWTLVAASWMAVTIMFLWKGSAADITPYGAAVMLILAPMIAREITDKNREAAAA